MDECESQLQKPADEPRDFFQFARFFRCVFVLANRADAESSHNFFAVAQRHAQCAADAGLFRAGLGNATIVGLQITNCDRLVL